MTGGRTKYPPPRRHAWDRPLEDMQIVRVCAACGVEFVAYGVDNWLVNCWRCWARMRGRQHELTEVVA